MKYGANYLLILSILLIGGCTIPLTCEIYNNSGSEVVITRMVDGEKADSYRIAVGQSVKVDEWEKGVYRISIGETPYSFDPVDVYIPNEGYVDFSGFGFWSERIARLQLESDGMLYLLRSEERSPVADFSTQPEGFPIELHGNQEAGLVDGMARIASVGVSESRSIQ